MPNSTVSASLLMQILDGLGSTNQPIFNHQIPPVQYSGAPQIDLSQNTSSAYLTLTPGTSLTLFNNPPISPFLFVRNAGGQGVLTLTVDSGSSPSGPAGPEQFNLSPGGIFLFANNSFSQANGNYLTAAFLGVLGNSPVVAEYVFGV